MDRRDFLKSSSAAGALTLLPLAKLAGAEGSLKRAQTKLQPDGRYRIVVAGRDPGVPNRIDTEGRPSGLVYWRFLLPEGEIETPRTRVVPLSELQG